MYISIESSIEGRPAQAHGREYHTVKIGELRASPEGLEGWIQQAQRTSGGAAAKRRRVDTVADVPLKAARISGPAAATCRCAAVGHAMVVY